MIVVGEGKFRYEVIEGWAKLPPEWHLGDVAAVATDREDNVYLFTRGDHPIIVLNSAGDVLRTWGHGVFNNPHGLHLGHDGCLYCTDDGDHTVRKCSLTGEVLLIIGLAGQPAPFMSGTPFHRCTHTALAPNGDIFVSDGYGNACIHKFDPAGRHLKTWGECGTLPGQFYIPHNLLCDEQGWVYVADRENHRVQVFDGEGRFETQWTGLHRPCALCGMHGQQSLMYVGEAGPALGLTLNYPNLGPRLSVVGTNGAILARIDRGPAAVGAFIAPHGMAVDSRGDLYIGEVSSAAWRVTFPDRPQPPRIPSLSKLRRL